MEKVFEDMLKYLSTASKEQLREDWEKFKKYNDYGPIIDDLFDNETSQSIVVEIQERFVSNICENSDYIQPTNNINKAA